MRLLSDDERIAIRECWSCKFMMIIPRNAHIQCSNPDPEMVGREYGIKNGWFNYPSNFDPCWKTKICNNFEKG
jgi:hypothetical protein